MTDSREPCRDSALPGGAVLAAARAVLAVARAVLVAARAVLVAAPSRAGRRVAAVPGLTSPAAGGAAADRLGGITSDADRLGGDGLPLFSWVRFGVRVRVGVRVGVGVGIGIGVGVGVGSLE